MTQQRSYYCSCCDYQTNHKAKFDRHLETLKHQISESGITCCGLLYYDKHRWVNHKKSVKHHHNKGKTKAQLSKETRHSRPKLELNLAHKVRLFD